MGSRGVNPPACVETDGSMDCVSDVSTSVFYQPRFKQIGKIIVCIIRRGTRAHELGFFRGSEKSFGEIHEVPMRSG